MLVFTALKRSQFQFLFANTAAGAVPCGGPKKSPVHHHAGIFWCWSVEISEDILRSQNFFLSVKIHFLNNV